MNNFILILIGLGLVGCAPLGETTQKDMVVPNMNQADILDKWGPPSEILLMENDIKLGEFIVTWVYYVENAVNLVSPVFYNFRRGDVVSTNSFVVKNGNYRIMNTNNLKDFKLILARRDEIKRIWKVWPD